MPTGSLRVSAPRRTANRPPRAATPQSDTGHDPTTEPATPTDNHGGETSVAEAIRALVDAAPPLNGATRARLAELINIRPTRHR